MVDSHQVDDISAGFSQSFQEILIPDTSPKGRRKHRHVDKSQWKVSRNALKREKGESYKGKKMLDNKWAYDVLKDDKSIKERCNCALSQKESSSLKCKLITDEERLIIFKKFWSMQWSEKKLFVQASAERIEKQRKRQRDNDVEMSSRRANTIKYFLGTGSNRKKVCQTMFRNTLGVHANTILNWLNLGTKTNDCTSSNNPFSSNENSVTNRNDRAEIKAKVVEFFTTLPKMESHYCRKSSQKLYLEPIWQSKVKLFEEYKHNWCGNHNVGSVSLTYFSNIFEDMNLSLFRPKKDRCDTCVGFETKNITEEVYRAHQHNKEQARLEKDNDKKGPVRNVFTVDLQSVLLSPQINVSASYYKTKLKVHNLTFYNIKTNEGYCFLWHESEGGLGSNEFSSIFNHFILEVVIPRMEVGENREIIFFSDGCNYQNRNSTLSNAILNIAIQKNIIITQKYLEKGHTQMECDSMHSVIERKIRCQDIYVPADYVRICKTARRDPKPYQVKYLLHDFFKSFENLKFIQSIRPGRNAGDPTVTQLRAITYHPNRSIKFKLNCTDEWKDLPTRINLKLNPCEFNNLPQLYENAIKIKADKFNHLQSLKNYIPQDYHPFYDQLPHH